MGSVVGPSPAIARFSPESDVATGNFAIRSGRPTNTPAGGYGAMQQPRRAVSMTPGSYAQFDNRPVVYDRNGRPLSSASSNGSTAMTRDSFESRMRSPASSRTSFESWESHPKRPEYGWQRPAPIKQQRRKAQPGEQMAALPDEVLDMIMSEVRKLHLGKTSTSCATCMMRDFCSVALSSRRLLKIGRHALYEDIHLVGPDSQHQKKRLKIQYGSRMILLRRTLRSSPRIAAMVQSLRLPAQPPGMPIDQYLNLLASVVMACPNLERLAGPHQSYDHTFNRLVHALSTRNKLKEMTWVVEASSSQRQHRAPNVDTEPEELLPQQSTAFLELNMHWSQLTTLTIHCLPEAALTPVSLVTTALSTMPALQHLHLSKLSAASFDDTDLLALPPLKTLSLTSLPGITNAGLTAYFTARRPSQPLKSLTLQHLDLHSLPALGRLFLNFGSLEKFALVQSTTPILPEGEVIWLFPYLASNTLRKLHWDITSHENCANVADSVLAKSIAAGGFPSLHNLRAPNDPEGLFQNLCRPVEKIEKPSDKYRGRGLVAQIDSGPSTPRTPTTPMKSPAKSPFMPQMQPMKLSSDLHQARRAAQARLEEARNTPRFTVNVIEEDGSVVEKFGLGGFLGEVGSQIEYCLSPDPGAKDENGGLVQMSDVLSMKAEEGDDLDGCTGRWNSFGDINYDKKEKERWWHTERANWTEVRLS